MFINNKYKKWYLQLTSKKDIMLDCYTEKHHIIPVSLGGSNNVDNLVILTAREHFIAHLLLTKITDGKARRSMLNAFMLMCNMKSKGQERYAKINSHLFEKLKECSDLAKREYRHTYEAKQAISDKLKGVPKPKFTNEHKANISASHIGQQAWNKGIVGVVKFSNETRLKMRQSALGKDVSDVTKAKLSEAGRGKITCYDKDLEVVVKIDIDMFNKQKNIRYITTRTNEYKLIKKEKESLCLVA